MARTYSHSRLSTFENCPRRFHYRYVQRLPAETESIEAFLGKRVHEILERLHLVVRQGRVPSLGAVLGRFRSEWTRLYDAARVRIVRQGTDEESYRETGERCLDHHYRRHYPFDGDETLGIEERISFPLDANGTYRITGIVDRIVRARDGAVEIHDYKTGRRIPPQRVLDRDRQLAFYQIGLDGRLAGVPEVRLVWHYLAHDQVRVSRRTPEQLAALRVETRTLIERIESEQEFPARSGPLCDWCEYAALCPAVGGRAANGDEARRAARPATAPGPRHEGPPASEPAVGPGGQMRLL